MILDCAACGARYLLAERAIGPEGRHVRCAACGLGWFAAPMPYDLRRPLPRLPPGGVRRAPVAPTRTAAPATRSEWDWPGFRPIGDAVLQRLGRTPRSTGATPRPRQNPARLFNWLAAGSGAVLLLASGAVVALANSTAPAIAPLPRHPGLGPESRSVNLGMEAGSGIHRAGANVPKTFAVMSGMTGGGKQ